MTSDKITNTHIRRSTSSQGQNIDANWVDEPTRIKKKNLELFEEKV